MVKLSNGHFVSLTKLQEIYENVPLIKQIYIDTEHSSNILVAVVCLDQQKLEQFCEVNGLDSGSEELFNNQDVKYGVIKQLERAANQNKLNQNE